MNLSLRVAHWRIPALALTCLPRRRRAPNTVLYLISLIRKSTHKHIGDALIRRFAQKQTSKSKEASYAGMATDRDRTDKRATQPRRVPVRHADPAPCRCLRAGRHEPRAPGGVCGGGSVEGWMGWPIEEPRWMIRILHDLQDLRLIEEVRNAVHICNNPAQG